MDRQLFELEEAFAEYNKTGVVAKCLSDLYDRSRSPKRLLGKRTEGVDMAWIEKKIEQRRNQLYNIAPEDFEHAKELFSILQVPYLTAPGEAEKMCSVACIQGLVEAVLSEDTDVMAYGAPVFLSKIDSSSDTCIRIRQVNLLSALELDKHQFLDLCIMCGTDYNPNIPRIGSKTAYKLVLQHGGIDQIAAETDLDTSVLNHKRVRQLFTEFECEKFEKIPFCGTPDFLLLEKFVKHHKIQVNIEKLRKDFTHNVVIFEGSEEEDEIIEDSN